jgi:uncharacterized protein YbaP (TraB family)
MSSQTPAKSPDEKRSTFACAAAVAAESVSGTSRPEAIVLPATELACPTVELNAPSAMPQEEHAVANSTADKTAANDLIVEG